MTLKDTFFYTIKYSQTILEICWCLKICSKLFKNVLGYIISRLVVNTLIILKLSILNQYHRSK